MSKAKPYTPKPQTNIRPKRGTVLYLFLLPLGMAIILALFQTNIQAFALNSVAFGLFLVTAKLSTIGFTQETHYLESTLTKAPKIPYKQIAAYLLGSSTLLTAWIAGDKPFTTALFLGAVSTLGYYLYYGFDPKIDKLENLGDVSAEYALEVIAEAEEKLRNIELHQKKIADTILSQKLNVALSKAKSIVETIKSDPKDIRVARKFLIVYIDGVLKVTESYVSMNAKLIDNQTQERLHTLMDELDVRLDKELKRVKENNLFDLDVHIDVLKEQIKN